VHRVTRARRGMTLAELLVALVLAAIVSAAVAAALSGAERQMRRAVAASTDRRTLREAELVLSAELRAAPADSLRLLGDTAVEFPGLVGTSVVCVGAGNVVVLPPAAAESGAPYSVWRARPEVGDMVVAFDTLGGGHWSTATVDSVDSRPDGAGCLPASGLLSAADSVARQAALWLRLDRALTGARTGAPLRVIRRARYVLLRGVNHEWTLSYRRCDPGGACEASQPVVGALASAADSGLVFALQTSPTRLAVTLRTPLREPGLPRETQRLSIALRNRATADP
jgi:prepilin-type N-terminal cleavage/methylation domain-containing protein